VYVNLKEFNNHFTLHILVSRHLLQTHGRVLLKT